MAIQLAVGTVKGAFIARSDDDRRRWDVEGPLRKGWQVTAFGRTAAGDYLMATGSTWYGAAVHRSRNLSDWSQDAAGPAYPEGSGRKLTQIWTLETSGDTLYAGVDEAGLFRSDDDGASWEPVTGLNEHPTRAGWHPGLGGLAAHRVLVDPADHRRIWCAISAVGVLRSDDGGATWEMRNEGVAKTVPSDDYPEIGYCVHSLVADPTDAGAIWRQDHQGVYRSRDGGDSWDRVETGLPAAFGFPVARDDRTGRVFVIPLESDEYRMPVDGALRVYRSDDGGDHWSCSGTGMPETPTFAGVLRGAMDTDGLDPCGVYVGTTAGTVHYSRDSGETWDQLPWTLPRVLTVTAFGD